MAHKTDKLNNGILSARYCTYKKNYRFFMLQLPRRLSSNANPVRRYPKTLSAIQKKNESVVTPESLVRTVLKEHLILL